MRAALLLFAACVPQPQYQPTPAEQPADERMQFQPPRRTETVTAESAVDGVEIAAKPDGVTGWRIEIRNNTDSAMRIAWDDSTFVLSDGRAGGRLIRGVTRKIDTAKSQPPSPLPANTYLVETVFPETLTDIETEDAERVGEWIPRSMLREMNERREKLVAAYVGGQLFVAIDAGGERKTWKGVVKK